MIVSPQDICEGDIIAGSEAMVYYVHYSHIDNAVLAHTDQGMMVLPYETSIEIRRHGEDKHVQEGADSSRIDR